MARKTTVDDDELLEKLTKVFTSYGYDGASLTILSSATGLKRASLYHRFPGERDLDCQPNKKQKNKSES